MREIAMDRLNAAAAKFGEVLEEVRDAHRRQAQELDQLADQLAVVVEYDPALKLPRIVTEERPRIGKSGGTSL